MARLQTRSAAAEQALALDITACDGHGICAQLLPELIGLDDWGYPILRRGPIPPELRKSARWAVANCPKLALSIVACPAAAGPGAETSDIRR